MYFFYSLQNSRYVLMGMKTILGSHTFNRVSDFDIPGYANAKFNHKMFCEKAFPLH